MKIRPFRKDDTVNPDTKFVYKNYKMAFHTIDSLELHKRKSWHFTGLMTLENMKSNVRESKDTEGFISLVENAMIPKLSDSLAFPMFSGQNRSMEKKKKRK
jgi:hypothetical protein